jgi:hypothetical protein
MVLYKPVYKQSMVDLTLYRDAMTSLQHPVQISHDYSYQLECTHELLCLYVIIKQD